MVGKKVAVLYDDGKWYPADIISHQPNKKEPFTLRFETGETVDTELPDKDIRPLPDDPCDVCNKDECFEDDLLIRSSILLRGSANFRRVPPDASAPLRNRPLLPQVCGLPPGGAPELLRDPPAASGRRVALRPVHRRPTGAVPLRGDLLRALRKAGTNPAFTHLLALLPLTAPASPLRPPTAVSVSPNRVAAALRRGGRSR